MSIKTYYHVVYVSSDNELTLKLNQTRKQAESFLSECTEQEIKYNRLKILFSTQEIMEAKTKAYFTIDIDDRDETNQKS